MRCANYCRQNCYYCGIRSGNHEVERYRLTHKEIIDTCQMGAVLGFQTFVLQGGEDPIESKAGKAYSGEIHSTLTHRSQLPYH